jgi:hypothetical protein
MYDDDAGLVRERAYLIWDREGRPEGRAGAHWQMAKDELALERSLASADPPLVSAAPDLSPDSSNEPQVEPAPRRRPAK